MSFDEDEGEEISMSRHLFERLSCFLDTSKDSKYKVKRVKSILPYIEEIDGYLSFTEPSHEGQLPALEWNTHFRKAYTLLLWIRPVLGAELETTIFEDNTPPPLNKLLYRFSTSHDNASGIGVCACIGQWRVLQTPANSSTNQGKRLVQTTLTAFSLPHKMPTSPEAAAASGMSTAPYVTAPLEMIENEWSLIGITHVFPYLKRPHWTVSVNGRVAASGELNYPVLDKTPIMQFNTLFQNSVTGGAMVMTDDVEDSRKPASELQYKVFPRVSLSLHLASFCLCKEALSSTIQALLAQAGPALSLQQNGALPLLPPIANWSKGSSLEGPNVGIPLVVHGQALQVQQLAGSCIVWGSAVDARLLGASDPLGMRGSVQRIICRMPPKHGTTVNAPRVGLIQPSPPTQYSRRSSEAHTDSDMPISLTILGACSVHHNLSDYLLHSPDVTNVDTQLFHCTKHFSLLIQGQALDSQLLLPFFLALPPPGAILALQGQLVQESLKHLYALYTNDGELAASLISVLTASLRTGGGRWHEEVLQNGDIHILATTLRQSLVRAEELQVKKYASFEDFAKVYDKPITNATTPTSILSSKISPLAIPQKVADVCIELLDACCGPPSVLLEDLSPSMQIKRTSDLALTALFGFALDLEIWGQDTFACHKILQSVANRYGGPCVTAGYIVRSQISVQFFLDLIKSQLDNRSASRPSEALKGVADACAKILQAMLLSSLTNQRSISQGEHDISSCMGALSDCPLGSVGSHVIFTAIVGVLQWCEIFPPSQPSETPRVTVDEEHKMQVASRLGRNLLMGQFHDVIAPMLLSRTVFCGERTMSKDDHQNAKKAGGSNNNNDDNATKHSDNLSWQEHWRLCLVTFAWVSSIAGTEGVMASKSLGSLLLASGLAGSLTGVMDEAQENLVSSLLLPPPTMAMTMAITMQKNEWSYTDLLSERLQVMMPLVPGLVVSILSHPSDATAETTIAIQATDVLTGLLTAVGGAFHRVFGGLTHSAVTRNTSGGRSARSRPMLAMSGAVKAAKDYVPHLLVVAMILENHIALRRREKEKQDAVTILRSPRSFEHLDKSDDDAWVEVSSTVNESYLSDGVVEVPEHAGGSGSVEALLARLRACQKNVLTTISELMSNAMRAGGGEASTLMWRSVLSTLKESVAYASRASSTSNPNGIDGPVEESEADKKARKSKSEALAHNLLCRLAALVLVKCLKRDFQWEVWTPDLGSAVSRLCLLIEEKELLLKPTGLPSSDGQIMYSNDQVLLLCALLDILEYGRNTTGWCQLILPTPPVPKAGNNKDNSNRNQYSAVGSNSPSGSPPAASKLMLPVLQPSLRVAVECIGKMTTSLLIRIPRSGSVEKNDGDKEVGDDEDEDVEDSNGDTEHDNNDVANDNKKPYQGSSNSAVSLLEHSLDELKLTLTAAVVGMSFPNARDVALQAMASLRRAYAAYKTGDDMNAANLCGKLLCDTAEEIRVRYEGERRRRETALFDAYEDEEGEKLGRVAAADAQLVENMILGGDLIPAKEDQRLLSTTEEVDFETELPAKNGVDDKGKANEDFVLFHEAYSDGSGRSAEESRARMKWSQYEGLGLALEECKLVQVPEEDKSNDNADKTIQTLTPYLDAWDESIAKEAAESELVELFDSSMSPSSSGDEGKKQNQNDPADIQQLPILGSETAADAMTTFIEFAAVEKSRLMEVTKFFLPNHRNSSVAYSERFCWARFMEIAKDGTESVMDKLWERGIADGNRDIRSRLVTIPCSPQFKRYIPKYLDNSADMENFVNPTGTTRDNKDEPSVSEGNDTHHVRKSEASNAEIDEFTRNLLKTGRLEIVDITKKEIVDDDEPELMLPGPETSLDDDALFNEEPLEMPSPSKPTESETKTNTTEASVGAETSTTNSETTEVMSENLSRQEDNDSNMFEKMKLDSSHYSITSSAFASPPDNSSSTLSLIHSAAAGMIEQHVENCLHVKAEGSRKCSMLLTGTHLILEYDADTEGLYEGELMAVHEEAERQKMIEDAGGGSSSSSSGDGNEGKIQRELEAKQRELASLRPKSIRWNLSELSHVYLRRYRLRDSSLEMFFIPSGGTSFGGYGLYSPSTSLFLDFGPGYEGNTRRDDAAFAIMKRAPPQAIKQWPDRSSQFLHEQLSRVTMGWVEGRITNFDYLLHLNMLAGRSYNDICQYPVMPWVLSNYTSEEIPDLRNRENFRDLSKPMGALNPGRLEDFIERFNTFADPSIPPFMYGSHYSTSAGVVLHFLVRLHPFAGLHRQLQSGHFDVADRLFSSVPRTWEMCTGTSAAEVKELTPEWYCNPAFLKNTNKFKLGTSQEGEVLGDVVLPPWAKGKPETFVEVMRNALESDICSEMLPDWIDLIFGRKQQGPEAIAAHNVFFYLTYYGSVDVASIEDEALRQATELQIAHFGQCPMQLFLRPHVRQIQLHNYRRLSFYQILSAYTHGVGRESTSNDSTRSTESVTRVFGEPLYLPFFSAPISHWVHLDAPPPGPHSQLIGVRLAGTDRCLAIDARGVFHCFRWAWKAEEDKLVDGTATGTTFPMDSGCFIAQRELARFRAVPRLLHTPRPDEVPAVAISKTLFAGRSVLLVISDGDGRGGMAMQLVDPAKGSIRGESLISNIHSACITCIATDPIGTAAGHGGVGGEIAIVGSLDGSATIWRFMSSHYLPLRPRVRLQGHSGSKVSGVALNAAIHVAATVSSHRCCLHSIGNGNLIRTILPPRDTLDLPDDQDVEIVTKFADTGAVAISVQGFVVTVCETLMKSRTSTTAPTRSVITLHLFSLEGVSLGSKPLEKWRGTPHKMICTPDGTAVMVCSGRGVTIHRLSAITPLEFIDEWHITETDELNSSVAHAWDIDLGPSLTRPVVAAAACSNGSLRLHALAGISAYSERHKKSGLAQGVGSALAVPARRLRNAVGKGLGFGSRVVGVGKEIGKEVTSDVKERGVGGFLGSMFRKNPN